MERRGSRCRRPASGAVALLTGVLAGLCGPAAPARAASPPPAPHSRLPLGFEPNLGQAPAGAGYVAHGGAATLLLGRAGTTLAIATPTSVADVSLTLIGARPAAGCETRDRLPGVVNYVLGGDPRRWRTGVPTYATLACRGVYPGVELVRRGTAAELDDSLVLAPGADPGLIALGVDGAERVGLDAAGDVRIRAGGATVVARAPRAHQVVNGVRRAVAARYRVDTDRRLALVVGPHDPAATLVVESHVTYPTPNPLGERRFDQGAAIAVDPAGNAYVAGATGSSNFPTTDGVVQTGFGGGTDGFITKLNATGTTLLYSTYLGGSGFDQVLGIAVDPAGDAYVAGVTGSPDFPTTQGAPQRTLRGDTNAFVAKLDPAGAKLVYSTYLGGRGDDLGAGIALDRAGGAYITGSTRSADFPTTPGAFQTRFGGVQDAFVTRLDPAGAKLAYSTYLGGADIDEGSGVAVDAAGNAYVTGSTASAGFPTTPGAAQRMFGGGGGDAFVAKLDPAGARLVYSTFLGGNGDDSGAAIAVDSGGGAYVTGATGSANFPVTRGAVQTTFHGGGHDAFVTRLDPAGRTLVSSTFLGGDGFDLGLGIAVEPSGGVYVTGTTSSKNFPTTPGSVMPTYRGGGDDAFVTRLDAAGRTLLSSTFLGGGATDRGAGIALDPGDDAYVTGITGSADFPTTKGAVQPASGGGGDDAFVTRLDPAVSGLMYSTYLGGQGFDADLLGIGVP